MPSEGRGFDPHRAHTVVRSKVPTDQIAALIRANAGTWLAILAEDPELLARRVRDDRWSPLEYSCHVRDVFHVMDERLNLMIRLDDPTYQNWDQDRAAVEDHSTINRRKGWLGSEAHSNTHGPSSQPIRQHRTEIRWSEPSVDG